MLGLMEKVMGTHCGLLYKKDLMISTDQLKLKISQKGLSGTLMLLQEVILLSVAGQEVQVS